MTHTKARHELDYLGSASLPFDSYTEDSAKFSHRLHYRVSPYTRWSTIGLLIVLGLSFCFATVSVADQQIHRRRGSSDASNLCRKMGAALVECVRDGKIEEGIKCDQYLDTLLARSDSGWENLMSTVEVARFRKQPQKAIATVERILTEFPEAKFSHLTNPGRIVGQFWIASIALESGDYARAHIAYTTLLRETELLTDRRMADFVRIDVALLQADLFANTGKEAEAINILRARPTSPLPDDSYWNWGNYLLSRLENGVGPSRDKLRQTESLRKVHDLFVSCILAMHGIAVQDTPYPNGSGMYIYSLRVAADKTRKGVEAEAARLLLGIEYATRENDLAKAKAVFDELVHSDSFLAPEAGLWQIRCLRKDQKAGGATIETAPLVQELKARFPGYAPAIDECGKESAPGK